MMTEEEHTKIIKEACDFGDRMRDAQYEKF